MGVWGERMVGEWTEIGKGGRAREWREEDREGGSREGGGREGGNWREESSRVGILGAARWGVARLGKGPSGEVEGRVCLAESLAFLYVLCCFQCLWDVGIRYVWNENQHFGDIEGV